MPRYDGHKCRNFSQLDKKNQQKTIVYIVKVY